MDIEGTVIFKLVDVNINSLLLCIKDFEITSILDGAYENGIFSTDIQLKNHLKTKQKIRLSYKIYDKNNLLAHEVKKTSVLQQRKKGVTQSCPSHETLISSPSRRSSPAASSYPSISDARSFWQSGKALS